jgi:hypothetical protein
MVAMRLPAALLVTCTLAACTPVPSEAPGQGTSEYLYLWTASQDSTQPDFLVVLDVRADTGRYGSLVTTLPVPGLRNGPHHTEHAMAADGRLVANGFGSGQSFIFDLTDPAVPRVAAQFGDLAGYSHPHSFVRLPSGNILATFQMRHDSAGMGPGGLVELTTDGAVVRSSSAVAPGVPSGIRPYSLVLVPDLDRVVTTTTDMHDSPHPAREIQVWRLSDLALLHTFALPPGPRGDEADATAEPRLLSDGRTVLVSTFTCGLYLLEGLDGEAPSGRMVASFPRLADTWCAIPVVTGHHLLITVPAYPGVVSLDISDPAQPREVSRLTLAEGDIPHWIAMEPSGGRLVLTGYGNLQNRVLLVSHDSATGALALDQRFREAGATEPGFRMANRTWPHGGAGAGVPHGAVFSLPRSSGR